MGEDTGLDGRELMDVDGDNGVDDGTEVDEEAGIDMNELADEPSPFDVGTEVDEEAGIDMNELAGEPSKPCKPISRLLLRSGPLSSASTGVSKTDRVKKGGRIYLVLNLHGRSTNLQTPFQRSLSLKVTDSLRKLFRILKILRFKESF